MRKKTLDVKLEVKLNKKNKKESLKEGGTLDCKSYWYPKFYKQVF